MEGEWIEREPMYLSFDVYNCEYCGKNIPRYVWLESIDGTSRPFCTPEVADVYLRTRSRNDANVRDDESELNLTEQFRLIRQHCSALKSDT
jgi:hypothetical protein